MSNRKIIDEAWKKHRDQIIPAYAFPGYSRDHLTTFYAGAQAVLIAIAAAINPPPGQEVDKKILVDLEEEIDQLVQEIREKYPKARTAVSN